MTSLGGPWLEDASHKRASRLLWAAAGLIVSISIARIIRIVQTYGPIDQAAGVWTAIASDLSRDHIFYRPIISPAGFGGTRYFPLHVLLQGGMMRLNMGPVSAGLLIAISSAIAVVFGLFTFFRSQGVAASLAGPCAFIAMATVAGQWAMTTIRADLLPAALNLWGLVLCAGADEREINVFTPLKRLPLERAAGLFLLAFAAKITCVYGVVAAITALLLARRRREAIQLCLYMLIGVGIFFAAMHWATSGRFWQSFTACAASGADAQTFVIAPLTMLLASIKADPMAPLFWLLAVAALLNAPWSAWRKLPSLAFLAAAAMTLVVFASPGVYVNHLIDLHIMAVAIVVVEISRRRIAPNLGRTILALAALLALAASAQVLRPIDDLDHRSRWTREAQLIKSLRGPVLCENPIVPVLAGKTPVVLDPYMFAVMAPKMPDIADDLSRRLDKEEFQRIVLLMNPNDQANHDWFDTVYFGKPFREKVLKNYRLADEQGNGDCVLIPRKSGVADDRD